MTEKYKNFQSEYELDAQKEENKKARQFILEKAKKKYEISEAKNERARKLGEGTWMLDSVSQRIAKEEKASKKVKKKKLKKEKKKKYRSSSSSESDNEKCWSEVTKTDVPSSTVKGPQLQRESWMEAPIDLIPTTSRQELRDIIRQQKEESKRETEKINQPGQHALELNPYWRDGGKGLPEEQPEKKSLLPLASAGDGGVSWLRKAYSRCKDQAKEKGRSLEEVAAERWGSLKKLESMLAEAELKQKRNNRRPQREERDEKRDRERQRWYDSRSRESEHKKNRERQKGNEWEKNREEKNEKRNTYSENYREERDKDRMSNKSSRERRDHSKDREYNRRERDEFDDKQRSSADAKKEFRFQRPGSDSEEESHKSRHSISKSSHYIEKDLGRKSTFMKPSELESEDRHDSRNVDTENRNGRSYLRSTGKSTSPDHKAPRWKKKVAEEVDVRKDKAEEKEKVKRTKTRRKSSSPSSDSSSSNCESNSGTDHEPSDKDSPQVPPAKILTEQELNDLAAKILRAEIMGDNSLAAELKSTLEKARKLRETFKQGQEQATPDFSHRRKDNPVKDKKRRGDAGEEDDVVVLSRTSKSGMVRPVVGSSDEWGKRGGGKRRKKNVATHDTIGERTIYFDDDDKLDLKALVEQEKAGTAEDQNAMFARLAGKSQDRDLDVDDMFVSKAAQKQNTEQAAMRDRSAAIFEHKKINAAMEKCQRCLKKIPKHLIIALGSKSYLCLPHHRSLTEGHCLIVPMQHVASATSMDEDIWREMQLFRKSLVQMFTDQGQDVVFMETVMHLKHFPHTVIECVPLDKELGDLAPIYFKKAVQEAGPEWSDNKKIYSLSDKDIRHVIPKGFPYFSVDFGLQGGYATVIEDESKFPAYFGREIVGGMLDAEPTLWRNPHKQSFEDQRQKVLQFEQMWRAFDWTKDLSLND
ncbi:unnamed protein product [Lymnaea stagnalis]|uniref:CWF19-like protein 2 n=1 Tax=Lymnaea stagnalis TaxID=6523 RepID=A0AAV2IPW1_LYMST